MLRGALASLGETLRAKGLAARELVIALTLDDGTCAERAVRPARPTSHTDALFDHVRAALDGWRLEAPVTALALRATITTPAGGEQGDLLVPRWADPAALAAAFDRIRAREGTDAVAVPAARDGHLPQDRGTWRNAADAEEGDDRADAERPRARCGASPSSASPALRLLPEPAPIRVRLARAGLEAFRYRETWYDVTAWAGPERLAPRWWRTASGATRDYYTVRDRDGALWLLFRNAKRRTWFLEGWWD